MRGRFSGVAELLLTGDRRFEISVVVERIECRWRCSRPPLLRSTSWLSQTIPTSMTPRLRCNALAIGSRCQHTATRNLDVTYKPQHSARFGDATSARTSI